MHALTAAFDDFSRRLDGEGPVGVAVSGGGDSVALLYALRQWGRRPLEVFCVDHGLNPASRAWTDGVARHAARVGAGFTALAWQGDKPLTGLSAAAREARHRLLAGAAWAKDIRVLCLGHTRDDIAEAEMMREDGSNVSAPQAWAPSPAWPQGRGLFLYRPFLNVRRATLRDVLREQGVDWIDDPANENPLSARARARFVVPETLPSVVEQPPLLTPAVAEALLDSELAPWGLIAFRREVFDALPREAALRLLATAAVCAGGGIRLPRRADIERALAGLAEGRLHTLCGARLQAADEQIHIAREAGDIARHGATAVIVEPSVEVMWDGRFAITSREPGQVLPAAGLRARLEAQDHKRLAALPAGLRGSQAVWTDGTRYRLATNAALRQNPYKGPLATGWVLPRFLAAAGLYTRESEAVLPPDGAWR